MCGGGGGGGGGGTPAGTAVGSSHGGESGVGPGTPGSAMAGPGPGPGTAGPGGGSVPGIGGVGPGASGGPAGGLPSGGLDTARNLIEMAMVTIAPPLAIPVAAAHGLEAAGATPVSGPDVGAQAGGPDIPTPDQEIVQTLAPQPVEEVLEPEPVLEPEEEEIGLAALEEQRALDELNRIKRLIGAEQAAARGEWELGRLEDLGLRDTALMDPAERFMQKRSSLERKYGLPPFYGAAK